MVGVMATSSKRTYASMPCIPGQLQSGYLTPRQSTVDPCLLQRLPNTQTGQKAEIDVFLELSCFFHDPEDVGNLISGSSAFSKTSLNIRKFTVHVLLKPGLENFEHYAYTFIIVKT